MGIKISELLRQYNALKVSHSEQENLRELLKLESTYIDKVNFEKTEMKVIDSVSASKRV